MPKRIAAWMIVGAIGSICAPTMGQLLDSTPQMGVQAQAPNVVFTQSSVDFGKISDAGQVEHRFEFQNLGPGELVIRDAKGSCGCTVPTLSKKNYAAGEKGTIQVFFNPAGRRGLQNQTVTIQTNDPKQPVIRLGVQAEVQPRTMVNPQSLSFGFVPKNAGPTMDVVVSGIEPDFDVSKAFVELTPLPPTMQDAAPEWDPAEVFVVEMGERKESVVDGRTYQERTVHVRMAKDAPMGLLRNVRLVVEHNDEASKRFELPILATQLGDITMTPPRLSFGRVEPGDPIRKEVIVRSSSNTPFEITKIEHLTTSGQSIEYKLEPVPGSEGAMYKLILTSDGISTQGAIRGQLRMHTNVKDEEIINYSYVGAVMPSQAAGAAPMRPTTVPASSSASKP